MKFIVSISKDNWVDRIPQNISWYWLGWAIVKRLTNWTDNKLRGSHRHDRSCWCLWSTARAVITESNNSNYNKSREKRAESKGREYSNSISSISSIRVCSYISVTYQLCISSMSLHTVLILYLYLNKIGYTVV